MSIEEALDKIKEGIRYWVVEESVSGHCCFSASVVDLSHPMLNNGRFLGYFFCICECFDQTDAELIAAALNKA